MRQLLCLFFLLTLLGTPLVSQDNPGIRTVAEQHVAQNQQVIIRELDRLLRIPDVAADRVNVRRKAELLRDLMKQR